MDIDSSMHAKLTRRHKEIKPKQLYAMAFDAFFGIGSAIWRGLVSKRRRKSEHGHRAF